MSFPLRMLVGGAALVLSLSCTGQPPPPSRSSCMLEGSDVSLSAFAALSEACRSPLPQKAVPAAPFERDVAVYTAHPDDESMYVGGTLVALTRAGRKVSLTVASHGEGGRLMERGPDGVYAERRDYSREHVARVRDEEMQEAAKRAGITLSFLYPAQANVDFEWTTSAEQALRTWDTQLSGGLTGMVRLLVEDIRVKKPQVLITLDPRDDPHPSGHGHHKAVGILVDLAARMAADPQVKTAHPPHVVEEVLSFAPAGQLPAVRLTVTPEDRTALLAAHASQFTPEVLQSPLATRIHEDFMLRWRAHRVKRPSEGSVLESLLPR